MLRLAFAIVLSSLVLGCPATPPPKSNPPRQPADPPPNVCVDPEIKKCPPE